MLVDNLAKAVVRAEETAADDTREKADQELAELEEAMERNNNTVTEYVIQREDPSCKGISNGLIHIHLDQMYSHVN